MASPSIQTPRAVDPKPPEVKELPPRAIQRLVNPRDLVSSKWLVLAAVAVIVAVIGYVPMRQWILSKAAPPPPAPAVPAPLPSQSPLELETERIKALLEDVRQANLKEDIALFMSCYSVHYKDRERKKRDTLQAWKETDYEDLSYVLKNQRVEGDVAEIEVEWSVRVSPKSGSQPEENQVILGASLEKEDGKWRIKEITPVS
jgi:ketosteroid isomerase-like protein